MSDDATINIIIANIMKIIITINDKNIIYKIIEGFDYSNKL